MNNRYKKSESQKLQEAERLKRRFAAYSNNKGKKIEKALATTIASSNIKDDEISTSTKIAVIIPGLLILAFLLWVVVGVIAQIWLATQVPITLADVKNASWLPSYSTATHFTGGVLGPTIGLAFVAVGIGMFVVKRSVIPLLITLIVVVGGYYSGREESAVRIGVLEGVIRVGCYVPESKECASMLGLSTASSAPSRYDSSGVAGDATWYTERLSSLVNSELANKTMLASLPGGFTLMAPFHFLDAKKLSLLLDQQRAEVEALRQKDRQTKS
jgi:hypothetical protein